jgi:hypothetical protein
MSTIIFKTEDAVFQFERKSVMECLELQRSSYEIRELNTLIDALSNQAEHTILSSAEHQYFGFIALDLINASEGSVTCNNCNCHKQYHFNQLEAFAVGPDDASVKAATSKKGGFTRMFRKRPKNFPMYGGKGYKCPRGHILIYMQTWIT